MANKKVVVAFSGGLDTSYTVMKLTQDGWDVYAACANTGGFSAEQLKTNEENAYLPGYRHRSLRQGDWCRCYRSRKYRCRQRPDPFRHDLPGDGSWCRNHHLDT